MSRLAVVAALAAVLLVPCAGVAQAPGPPAAQLAAMEKLDWLVGRWRGEAVIQTEPGQSRTVTQTETVQRKLGGALLLVEGKGTVRPPGQEERTVFEALAVLSYDDQANRYRWQAYTGGHYADGQAKVSDGFLEWRLPRTTEGERRYTIRRTEAGEWHEIGECSSDGVRWTKFMEMRLRKER